MSVSRSQLGRGPAIVTWNSITMFTRDDLVARHAPVWRPVMTSMYGEVDKDKGDLVIRIPMRLWGAWENLTKLFPSAFLSPNNGATLYGTTDLPLVILAKNGDQITYHNAQLTRVSDLFLGVDNDLFASDVEFTAIVKDNTEPETANAYYTVATAQSYTDNAFAKTNWKKVRWTGAWGAVTGFTSIKAQAGFTLSWDLSLSPVTAEGVTVDMTIDGVVGTVRCIPIGPTLAQIESATKAQGVAPGSLLSTSSADLTLTGSGGGSIVLKNAGPIEHGYAFGRQPLRVGEFAWSSTRGFTTGAPNAVATVA